MEYHEQEAPKYVTRIVECFNLTLKRYIFEALHLFKMSKNHNIMNQKAEWGRFKLPRLQITTTRKDQDPSGQDQDSRLLI